MMKLGQYSISTFKAQNLSTFQCSAKQDHFLGEKKSTERFFFASKTIKTIVELEELKSIGNPLKTH
jgi:hypothetical protein